MLCAKMCDRTAMAYEMMSDDGEMMQCAAVCRKFLMQLKNREYYLTNISKKSLKLQIY